MPRRLAVAATRQAISPRLAIRIFLNMLVSPVFLPLPGGEGTSVSKPRRPALLKERLHAFLAFVAGTHVGDAARRVFAPRCGQRLTGNVLYQRLARAQGHRPVADHRRDDLVDLGVDLVERTDRMDEAERLRLHRAEALGGHEVTPRSLLAQRAN